MPLDPGVLADVVVQTLETALGPVLERLAALEARSATVPEIVAQVGALRERTAVLETRPPVPGPPGEPGPAGTHGADGQDGKAGLTYLGVYQEGKAYELGEIVTWAGSCWHCNEPATATKPGDGLKAWTLMVKRGRDGKGAA